MRIDTSLGSIPDWNTQAHDPRLYNMFVDKEGNVEPTPGLKRIGSLTNIRQIWESNFDGGTYIVVTDDQVYRVKKSGAS